MIAHRGRTPVCLLDKAACRRVSDGAGIRRRRKFIADLGLRRVEVVLVVAASFPGSDDAVVEPPELGQRHGSVLVLDSGVDVDLPLADLDADFG